MSKACAHESVQHKLAAAMSHPRPGTPPHWVACTMTPNSICNRNAARLEGHAVDAPHGEVHDVGGGRDGAAGDGDALGATHSDLPVRVRDGLEADAIG